MKAIALLSGGLDSILAANLIQGQGIEVLGIHFKIPFCRAEIQKILPNPGFEIRQIDISRDFLSLLENPRYGFGSSMNPCIDCKILMLKKARELMPELQASFVVTGEVLGQRPMSQHRQALGLIQEGSGLGDLLVRPLCARILGPSRPEKEGWLDREKLLGFNGRSRRPQMELAAKMGLKGYLQPAGGCLLTEEGFSRKLKDLIAHKQLNLRNIEFLKTGRHFRLSDDVKLIVGRDESENIMLESAAQEGEYLILPSEELAGPTALISGKPDRSLLALACGITARYCDLGSSKSARLVLRSVTDAGETTSGYEPLGEEDLKRFRL